MARSCEIAINKPWFDPIPAYEKKEVLAHEYSIASKEIAPDNEDEAKWISQGLDRWVDLTLFPATHLKEALVALTGYYNNPGKSLFTRSYDSVGFWAHVQDTYHGDLWQRIPKIVQAGIHGQNQAAFDAAVSDEDSFLSTWGSSALRPDGSGHRLADEQPALRPPLARRSDVGQSTRSRRRDEVTSSSTPTAPHS